MMVKTNKTRAKTRKTMSYIKFQRTRKALVTAIKASTNLSLDNESAKYFKWFDNQIKGRGTKGALTRFKQVHHVATNYFLRQPKLPEYEYLAVDNDGFPKCIKYLKKYNRTPQGIQAALSLLAYYRVIKLPADPDFSTITKDGGQPGDVLLSEIVDNTPDTWKFKSHTLSEPKPLFRSKRGPNGHATYASVLDFHALLDDEKLHHALETYLENANGEILLDLMEELSDNLSDIERKKLTHSKISIKREGGGKSRPFAITDYWTQTALKPLHNRIFKILNNIPQDCTFNQEIGIPIIKSWTETSKEIHCFDLRAATDRWPLILQIRLLERLTSNSTFAEAWGELMTNRSYRYKRRSYRWQQGQPLGSLSSWSIFTLSHHLVMRTAYRRAKYIDKTIKLTYYILGDDVIINGDLLASCYKEILTDLFVEIQDLKTIQGSSAEFIKRHFFKGTEVSAIPINLIASTCSDPLLINSLVDLVLRRKSIQHIGQDSVDSLISCVARNKQQFEQLRLIVSNPITGKPVYDAHQRWGTIEEVTTLRDNYKTIYSVTKYKYLVKQYSSLMSSYDKFCNKLDKVVLPGILPDTPEDINPMISTLKEKYVHSKGQAHKELGKYWSKVKLSKEVLPTIPRLSLKVIEPNYKRRSKLEAKVIISFHKNITRLRRNLQSKCKIPMLISDQNVSGKKALHRNLRALITTRIGSEIIKD